MHPHPQIRTSNVTYLICGVPRYCAVKYVRCDARTYGCGCAYFGPSCDHTELQGVVCIAIIIQ